MKLIPEWLPHEFCLIAWPCNKLLYKKNIYEAKKQVALLANIISEDEKVIIVCNFIDLKEVKDFIQNDVIKIFIIELDDSWMRDISPIFIKNKNQLSAINFQFNGYGKYPNFLKDNLASLEISKKLKIQTIESKIILEGGSITYDEQGNLFTTKNVIFNKNRKQILNTTQINNELMNLFDLKKIYYFPAGLLEDDTDGHIDNVFCPIGNNRYLIASTDKKNDNFEILMNNKKYIENEFKKNNHNFELIEIPLPEETVFDDKKLIASYINFYYTRNKIILPKFFKTQDSLVKKIFMKIFKNRDIIFLDTRAINYGGGNIHCVTMNVPKL